MQNWYGAATGGHTDALQHTWSLSIEEQFYIVWPLVLLVVLRLRRSWQVALVVAAALASTLWRAHLWGQVDAWRLYVGTDTRADGLLLGCALALGMSRTPRGSRAALPVSVVGLVLAARMSHYGYHVVAPFLTSCATLLLLVVATSARPPRLLLTPALRWLGGRSYSLYLWHIPVMLLVQPLPRGEALPLYLVGTLVATELSRRFVEEPFLRRAPTRAATTVAAPQVGELAPSLP